MSFCLVSNAQLKLHSSGSMSIGSTNDPGSGKVSFDHEAIFNNGSNLFNKYNSGGGLTVKGSTGTFSMYGDNDHYKLSTSKDYFSFEDEVRITDGLKVNATGSSEFWSTSTFKSTVNFGEYGTVNNTTFYGNVLFESANASATFTSNRAGSFNNGLTVSNLFRG